MAEGSGRCAFCGATGQQVAVGVLDDKWSRRFGGDPVVALDHGWYTTSQGARRAVDQLDPSKFFGSHVRAVCDFCAHGWMEDVRWRAEPALLALAQGRAVELGRDADAIARWAQLTAMLAELVEGMPRAASAAQRDAVRRGAPPAPPVGSWLFTLRQRLPARVHLSQVTVPANGEADRGFVQIVSVDLSHLSVLVLLPSDGAAGDVVARADVAAALGIAPAEGVPSVDLSRTLHPHKVAVQRVCAASGVPAV